MKPGPRVFRDSLGWGYVVTSFARRVDRVYVLREDDQSLRERRSEAAKRVKNPRVGQGGLSLGIGKSIDMEIKPGRVGLRYVRDQLANLILRAHARTFDRLARDVKRKERDNATPRAGRLAL
jgi:hypothetical protein